MLIITNIRRLLIYNIVRMDRNFTIRLKPCQKKEHSQSTPYENKILHKKLHIFSQLIKFEHLD